MTRDEQSMNALPDLAKELTMMNSENFREFEARVDRALEKTMTAFESMVDTGILATDPEQMVEAMKVLVKAKTDIADSKRKLIETTMRGLALRKVVEKEKPMTALDRWNMRHELEGKSIEETESNGMFGGMSK